MFLYIFVFWSLVYIFKGDVVSENEERPSTAIQPTEAVRWAIEIQVGVWQQQYNKSNWNI